MSMAMGGKSVGGQVPRIQLKWLLTLDLSVSIKNPKRCVSGQPHPRPSAHLGFLERHATPTRALTVFAPRAETRDSAAAKRKTDGAETTYGPSPGPSADEGDISADDKDSAEIGSVRRMAASIEKRAPRRSEAEALMRRVRALETEAREGVGNLADAFADATT